MLKTMRSLLPNVLFAPILKLVLALTLGSCDNIVLEPDFHTDASSSDIFGGIDSAVSHDVTACTENCPVGCPAPPFWLCGTDGNRYCSECHLTCHGLQQAENDAICDTPDTGP